MRDRFSWSAGDVVMLDEDGAVMTRRQVLVRQLEEARTEDPEPEPDPIPELDKPAEAWLSAAPAGAPTMTPNPLPSTDRTRPSAETLLNLGFIDLASWTRSGDHIAYDLDGPHAGVNRLRLEESNALYAFVRGENVLYIGKTARTIRKRFTGYCRPARQQRTNWRCNEKIKDVLEQGGEVRIFVFTPISLLRYGVFDVNLAAGLEDALIAEFDPPWNGRERGLPISEEAEREEAEEDATSAEPDRAEPDPTATGPLQPALASFEIKLGQAYFEQGLINPGVDASHHLGRDGEPIQVSFDDGSETVLSAINRTANTSGSVRVVGRNRQIATWIQRHFRRGDVVQARVLGPNHILLLSRS